jgi:hypothetical protein
VLYVKEESVSIKGSCSESEKSGSENNRTSGRLFPLCLFVFSFCYDDCYRYDLLSCGLLVCKCCCVRFCVMCYCCCGSSACGRVVVAVVQLCCCAVVRLCDCAVVRLCCCAVVQLCCCAVVRLCSCAVVRLCSCAVVQLCCYAVVQLCCCAVVLLCSCAVVCSRSVQLCAVECAVECAEGGSSDDEVVLDVFDGCDVDGCCSDGSGCR